MTLPLATKCLNRTNNSYASATGLSTLSPKKPRKASGAAPARRRSAHSRTAWPRAMLFCCSKDCHASNLCRASSFLDASLSHSLINLVLPSALARATSFISARKFTSQEFRTSTTISNRPCSDNAKSKAERTPSWKQFTALRGLAGPLAWRQPCLSAHAASLGAQSASIAATASALQETASIKASWQLLRSNRTSSSKLAVFRSAS
mmetsp:Transcript_92901/g.234018  ORF Transcript_92901/g.234018 Transcript_92901/m.234018 type:complete len:206 (+) Transcript_92901:149-766(+)